MKLPQPLAAPPLRPSPQPSLRPNATPVGPGLGTNAARARRSGRPRGPGLGRGGADRLGRARVLSC